MTRVFEVKPISLIADVAERILGLAPYIVLLASVIVSLILWSRNYASYVFLVAAITLGSIAYILLNRRSGSPNLSQEEITFLGNTVKNPQNLFATLYFIFYSLSILTLAYGFYSKSLLYYVCIALCVGIVFIEIAFSGRHQKPWRTLVMIYLLFLNISLSNQIIFPYGIGNPDDFYHIYDIMVPTVDTGHVPEGWTYSHFPCHHLIGAMTSLILGTLPRMTYYCLGTFFMSLGILFIYFIGSKFLGTRFGLLSALIYTCCDYVIYWAAHPVQMSYTYPIALMIVSVVLCSVFYKRSMSLKIIFILLTLLMVFTHHYTATIILFLILALCLSKLLLGESRSDKRELTWFASIYLFILFCQWLYYSGLFGGFIEIIDTYIDVFSADISSSVVSTTAYDAIPLNTLLLNEIGSCILICLSTIGALYCIQNRSKFFDTVLTMALLLGALIGVGVIINIFYLMPNRIYVFLQQFALVFLAGIAILWMLYYSKGEPKKIGAIAILVICLSFFSSASTIAGFETSLFTNNQPYWKFYETPQERYSCIWSETYIGDNNIAGGSLVCPEKNLSFAKYPIIMTEQGFVPDLSEMYSESYFQFNRFDIFTGVYYGKVMDTSHMGSGKWIRLSSSSENSFEVENKIYNNRMLSMYFRF